MPEDDLPRVSLNALSRYLTATQAGRRRRIVADQKRPQTYRLNYYEPAADAVLGFLLAGGPDESTLMAEMARLEGLPAQDEYEEVRHRTNSEAIAALLDSYDRLRLKRYELTRPAAEPAPPDLDVEGVAVSVQPDLILRHDVGERPAVGALKLYFSKAEPLTKASAGYATSLLLRYVREHLAGAGELVRPADCLAFDVFQGRLHKAPSGVLRRFDDVESACREIALQWPIA